MRENDHSKYANWIDPKDTIPYELNAKVHTDKQVNNIATSISRFGWQQDTAITMDNVVVIGHGRRLAAIKLGCQMPYHRVDKLAAELTEEDIRELRIADNETNRETGYDFAKLEEDLNDLDFDGFDFDFDLPEDDDGYDNKSDDRSSLQHNVFENQERRQFPSDNYYGFPVLSATQTAGDKMLRFCDWKEVDDHENYIAHFYYDDYKFIQAWREPDKYIDKLRMFKAVVAPDFSLYTDFPIALQILSCYRRQWCGAYWQSLGIDVIPDVVWGTKESYDFCFDGIPKHSTVAVSTVGIKLDKDWNNELDSLFRDGYNEMLKRLEPTTILFYGDMIEGLEGNIIRSPSFYEERRKMLNERMKEKKLNGKRE